MFVIVFIWHLLIALIFIIALYLGATYSALCSDLSEIKDLREKINTLNKSQELTAKNEIIQKKLLYYTVEYEAVLKSYEERRQSIYARPLNIFTKKFNQQT